MQLCIFDGNRLTEGVPQIYEVSDGDAFVLLRNDLLRQQARASALLGARDLRFDSRVPLGKRDTYGRIAPVAHQAVARASAFRRYRETSGRHGHKGAMTTGSRMRLPWVAASFLVSSASLASCVIQAAVIKHTTYLHVECKRLLNSIVASWSIRPLVSSRSSAIKLRRKLGRSLRAAAGGYDGSSSSSDFNVH
jgi:hypothetical protein